MMLFKLSTKFNIFKYITKLKGVGSCDDNFFLKNLMNIKYEL